MEELYDSEVINITIDPHRSFLAMADIAKGFALVVSAIQFHFIRNSTPVDFNCSDNPVVYFPHGQEPTTCEPYQFRPIRPFEFIFPITNRCCLYHNSQYPIRAQQIAVTETNDSNLVGRINKFIGAFADRYLVSSKELNGSELPVMNLCPRLTEHRYPEERGTFLCFQYEMGEPLRLPKWKNKFEPA